MNDKALPALVDEALTYFAKAGDEGDLRYVDAIRKHIAALSQTAGVAEGMVIVPLFPTPEMDAAGKSALSDNGVDNVEDSDALVCYAAMVRAAPAASGGEDVGRGHGNPPEEYTDWEKRVWQRGYRAGMDGQHPPLTASNPPAGASVSERARALLADEYAKDTDSMLSLIYAQRLRTNDRCEPWAKELSALEQALTQQRGDDGSLQSLREAIQDAMATTTQPGAEALRELVRRILDWQPLTSINKADRLYQILVAAGLPFESVTDELESLLGRGGAK